MPPLLPRLLPVSGGFVASRQCLPRRVPTVPDLPQCRICCDTSPARLWRTTAPYPCRAVRSSTDTRPFSPRPRPPTAAAACGFEAPSTATPYLLLHVPRRLPPIRCRGEKVSAVLTFSLHFQKGTFTHRAPAAHFPPTDALLRPAIRSRWPWVLAGILVAGARSLAV